MSARSRDWLVQSKGARSAVKALLGLVGAWLDRKGPHTVEGQHLDPSMRAAILGHSLIRMPEIQSFEPAKARRVYAKQIAPFDLLPAPMSRVETIWLGGEGEVEVTLLVPKGLGRHAPLLVWFHGGGWVIGGPDTCEMGCRHMAQEGHFAVAMVRYRLAPEHPCPAAHDDAFFAWSEIARRAAAMGFDPTRLAVGGDSAGGNLAACVSLRARDATDVPVPAFQALVYPATDLTSAMPSHDLFADGYLLSGALSKWFHAQYVQDPSFRTDPYISPLFAEDASNLPPAYVATAGFDILRDEGRAWAEKMRAAGVDVEFRCHEGLCHGFFSLAGIIDPAREAIEAVARAVSEGLAHSDVT